MKRLVFFLLVFMSVVVSAQNFDSLMTKQQQLGCSDITLGSSFYFKDYIERNEIDSAQLLLDYWRDKCGETEPVFRANVILYLVQKKRVDLIMNSSSLDFIRIYKGRKRNSKYQTYADYERYKPYYGYLPFNSDFDKFTKKIALESIDNTSKSSVDYLFCELYGDINDSILFHLQEDEFKSSRLGLEYGKTIKSINSRVYYNSSFCLGTWIPTGSMKKFGVKPSVGLEAGWEKNKMAYNIHMMYRIGKSNVDYLAIREDTGLKDTANESSGMYIGFEVGRILYQTKRSDFKFQAGLGLDILDVFADRDNNNNVDNATYVMSYNFNLGLGYRYYFKSTYIGLTAKYNFVNYRLGNIIDFSGNPITIHLSIGFPGFVRHQTNSFNDLDYNGIQR